MEFTIKSVKNMNSFKSLLETYIFRVGFNLKFNP